MKYIFLNMYNLFGCSLVFQTSKAFRSAESFLRRRIDTTMVESSDDDFGDVDFVSAASNKVRSQWKAPNVGVKRQEASQLFTDLEPLPLHAILPNFYI